MRESIHPEPIKQPKALYFLFMIEVWERFGFYVMRGLLVLYLASVFLFSDQRSYLLFGSFSALLWFTPIIGGYVADRIMGYRRSLIIGAIAFIIGYGLLTAHSIQMLYLGLSFILVGNGFFKPNVASLMGSLYDGPQDARREGGFTIYYMGINIGSLIALVFAGLIVRYWGWHAAFATSSAGLLIGLILFLSGHRILGERGKPTAEHLLNKKFLGVFTYERAVYVLIALMIVAGFFLLRNIVAANIVIVVFGVIFIGLFLVIAMKSKTEERNRLFACLILILFSVVFWTLYTQAPMTVNLFTERNVNRHIFGWDIPTVTYQSLNPLFIILLTPFLSTFWNHINRSKKRFSIAYKFIIATFLMGLGFLVLDWAGTYFNTNGSISSWWMVLSYGLQSLGELILQPVGLAAMTALAPKNMVGFMLGLWFFASTIANATGGWVAQIADVPQGQLSPMQSIHIYTHAFSVFGWWTVAAAVVALAFAKKVSGMIGD